MNRMKLPGLLCCLLIVFTTQAQDVGKENKWSAGIEAAGGLSYTGYNLFLLPSASYGRHTIYVGPKLAMTSSYFPYHNNWGVNAGYDIMVLKNEHWAAGMGLDYQCSFYKPYNPYQLESKHLYNKVHEMFLAVAISYKPVRDGRLAFNLTLGTGGFMERYDDVGEGSTRTNTGRTSLVKIGIGYKIY